MIVFFFNMDNFDMSKYKFLHQNERYYICMNKNNCFTNTSFHSEIVNLNHLLFK